MLRSLVTNRGGAHAPSIFLAPMANAGGVKLALAVAAAGGIASLPGAAMSTEDLRAGIRAVRAAGHEPIVNFFAHTVPVRRLEDDAKWLRFLRPTYEAVGLACDARVFTPSSQEGDEEGELAIKDFPHWFTQTAGRNPFDAASLQLVVEEQLSLVSFHFGLPRALPTTSSSPSLPAQTLADVRSTFWKSIAHFFWSSAISLRDENRISGDSDNTNGNKDHHLHRISVLSTATTPEECLHLYAAGVDGIILQGAEAGGHRGNFLDPLTPLNHLSTLELVKLSRGIIEEHFSHERLHTKTNAKSDDNTPALSRPLIIAAGGIATHSDVRAAIAAGADAVQVGTAFLNCEESSIPVLFRKRLVHGASIVGENVVDPTAVTTGFTGRPARGIANVVAALVPFVDQQQVSVEGEEGSSGAPPPPQVPPFPTAVDGWNPIRKIVEAQPQQHNQGVVDAVVDADAYTSMFCGTKVASSCFGVPRTAQSVVKMLRAEGV
ncbi:2-nitropropane dioxygenase, putative [Bodo saltans]|uniref:2-nitropropane dioxygenase, putative n=1 Tax=Bodo saltans TaxID=75058 RepID=A0A0S4J5C5_BODSA|nr:2-nitropropane dioxygenase, putative [Bodo saltans]|eukprot:CUG86619.1 2-nitropropane dioxygenase, putative [Bodo saltans]